MMENIKNIKNAFGENIVRYVVVVANNRIRGQLFESWKYLMPIAEKIGFKVENYCGSEIIKHCIKAPREERINTDWILELKK